MLTENEPIKKDSGSKMPTKIKKVENKKWNQKNKKAKPHKTNKPKPKNTNNQKTGKTYLDLLRANVSTLDVEALALPTGAWLQVSAGKPERLDGVLMAAEKWAANFGEEKVTPNESSI